MRHRAIAETRSTTAVGNTSIALTTALAVTLLAGGCGKKPQRQPATTAGGAVAKPAEQAKQRKEAAGATKATEPAAKQPPTKEQRDHGQEVAIGTVKLGERNFEVYRLGQIGPGKDGAVAAVLKAEVGSKPGGSWLKLNMYAWLEAADGQRLSAPSKAVSEAGKLHMHAALPASSRMPQVLVLRLRDGEVDVRAKVALPEPGAPRPEAATPTGDHGHAHDKTPHDGVVAELLDGGGRPAGWLELKLHDDKGDLELWLATDPAMGSPIDIPLDSAPIAKFVDVQGQVVILGVRDAKTNADEDGKSNVRGGKTNYFVFPGSSGKSADWLKGKDFQSIAVVTVQVGEQQLTSREFVLRPHTHGPNHKH